MPSRVAIFTAVEVALGLEHVHHSDLGLTEGAEFIQVMMRTLKSQCSQKCVYICMHIYVCIYTHTSIQNGCNIIIIVPPSNITYSYLFYDPSSTILPLRSFHIQSKQVNRRLQLTSNSRVEIRITAALSK